MGATLSFLITFVAGAGMGGSHFSFIEANRPFSQRMMIYLTILAAGCLVGLELWIRCSGSNKCNPEDGDVGVDVDAVVAGFLVGMGGVGAFANYSTRGTASDPDLILAQQSSNQESGIALSSSSSYQPVAIAEESDIL